MENKKSWLHPDGFPWCAAKWKKMCKRGHNRPTRLSFCEFGRPVPPFLLQLPNDVLFGRVGKLWFLDHLPLLICLSADSKSEFWCVNCSNPGFPRTKLGMGVHHDKLEGMTAVNEEHVAGWVSASQKTLVFCAFLQVGATCCQRPVSCARGPMEVL